MNYLYLFLVLSFISLNKCIIEIPIEPIKVKGFTKYPGLNFKGPIKINCTNCKFSNKTSILIDQGNSFINDNFLFVAKVQIGSRSQEFKLLLDTGSYIIWVPGKGSEDTYAMKNKFDPYSSTTAQNLYRTFNQQYGTGSCEGYYYSDYFKYIKDKQFQVVFGVAQKTLFNVDADGIIGLAHFYASTDYSFIHRLKYHKIIDSLSFSLKFGKTINSGDSGSLFLGRHKDFSDDDAVSCPLLTKDADISVIHWGCEISSFSIKNSNIELKSSSKTFKMVFDTGTNFLILPLNYYNDIKNDLIKLNCGVATDETQKAFSIICPKTVRELPDVRFEINGNYLTIPHNYIFVEEEEYPQYYFSRILFEENKNIGYIIGSPFFFAFHTLFDKENEQLLFYPESREFLEKGSNILTIILIIVIIIVLFLIFGYLIYRCYLWRKAKNELNDIPASNYNYNYI